MQSWSTGAGVPAHDSLARSCMNLRPSPWLGVCALSATLAGASLEAQEPGMTAVPGLGALRFPVSTSVAPAREAFLRGVLLLHLFEYTDAAAAFRQAERLDPGLALAYWGEAMTYNHAVWNEQDPDAGRAALTKLAPTPAGRARKAPTPREQGYLGAAELLYGAGSKARRDTLYSEAMGRVARAHPQDDEARLLYALSLLGLSRGVRHESAYLEAAALAESVFARNPREPGASHYLIHAVDDPEHATLGLAAARALARSSPAADHAQHMTSHIFVALGMWDDVVRANETAMAVLDRSLVRRNRSPIYCRHYNVWLDYGYVEQGRTADAARLLARCRDQAKGARPRAGDSDVDSYSFITMWSHYLLATGSWADSVARWTIDPGDALGARLVYWFTWGFTAARRGDLATARAALEAFGQAERETAAWVAGAAESSGDQQELPRARALAAELEGTIRAGEGRTEEALAELARATLIEDSMVYAFGPPLVNQPSHELLGEELLRLARYADALAQFRLALERTPRRTRALLGLARASVALADTTAAREAYGELRAIWHRADPGTAGVDEAQDYLRRQRSRR